MFPYPSLLVAGVKVVDVGVVDEPLPEPEPLDEPDNVTLDPVRKPFTNDFAFASEPANALYVVTNLLVGLLAVEDVVAVVVVVVESAESAGILLNVAITAAAMVAMREVLCLELFINAPLMVVV
jgi:hypothetical protein